MKYREIANLYHIDTDSFIAYIKTEDIYLDIANSVETRFDTLNYQSKRTLPSEKIKKLLGWWKMN